MLTSSGSNCITLPIGTDSDTLAALTLKIGYLTILI